MTLKEYLQGNRERSAHLKKALGISKARLSQMATGAPLNAIRCTKIETLTDGQVTRRDLRPADWWEIWPELITADHPIPG